MYDNFNQHKIDDNIPETSEESSLYDNLNQHKIDDNIPETHLKNGDLNLNLGDNRDPCMTTLRNSFQVHVFVHLPDRGQWG